MSGSVRSALAAGRSRGVAAVASVVRSAKHVLPTVRVPKRGRRKKICHGPLAQDPAEPLCACLAIHIVNLGSQQEIGEALEAHNCELLSVSQDHRGLIATCGRALVLVLNGTPLVGGAARFSGGCSMTQNRLIPVTERGSEPQEAAHEALWTDEIVTSTLRETLSVLEAPGAKFECVLVTGHGRGGALALVVAWRLFLHFGVAGKLARALDLLAVHTYNAPKVFNAVLADRIENSGLCVVRHYQESALMPKLPKNRDYQHVGTANCVGKYFSWASSARLKAKALLAAQEMALSTTNCCDNGSAREKSCGDSSERSSALSASAAQDTPLCCNASGERRSGKSSERFPVGISTPQLEVHGRKTEKESSSEVEEEEETGRLKKGRTSSSSGQEDRKEDVFFEVDFCSKVAVCGSCAKCCNGERDLASSAMMTESTGEMSRGSSVIGF